MNRFISCALFVCTLSLFPIRAAAANGCFVENGQTTCSTANLECTTDAATNESQFGAAVRALCSSCVTVSAERAQCATDFNILVVRYNENVNLYNKLYATFQGVLDQNKKLQSTMKKTCGKKCKKYK